MLEMKDVFTGYGKHEVLHGLSLSFEKGCLTSVVGTNGCGKSTLLKAALGFLPLANGSVALGGIPLTAMKRADIAKRVAYLAQGNRTPEMTVEQLVLHGRFPHLRYPRTYQKRDRAIALDAMRQMQMEALARCPLSTLSGGLKQSAYLAMALAQETDYILLDEPTTYLDISHQVALMKTLRTLAANGKGIVAVLHDLPLALSFSDRLIVLSEGSLVMQGTPREVLASGVLEQLFGVPLAESAEGGFGYRYETPRA